MCSVVSHSELILAKVAMKCVFLYLLFFTIACEVVNGSKFILTRKIVLAILLQASTCSLNFVYKGVPCFLNIV